MPRDLFRFVRPSPGWRGRPAAIVLAAILTASLAMSSGCAHRSLVRDRVRHRIESLRRTAALLVQREQSSPGRLKRTATWLAGQVSAGERWQRMRIRLERSWHAELRRGERIGRTGVPWLRRQLAGRAERIEPVAIRLFY